MKISLAQIDMVWEDKEANKKKCNKFLIEAKEKDTDLILFPEMTLTGFSMDIKKIAEDNDDSVSWFGGKAKELDINIGFGYVQLSGTKGRNIFSIVSPEGIELCKYAKLHPFSYGQEDSYYESGKDIVLQKINEFTVAPFICYDLRFPEIFQIVSGDAHLVTIIANWPKSRKEHWATLLKARAIENQCYIAAVNRVGSGNGLEYSGNSMVIAPDGKVLNENIENEGLITVEIDINEVDRVRKNFRVKDDRKEGFYVRNYIEKTKSEESYLKKSLLTNKNIVVTGACGLLGREICKGIAEHGGNVILADKDYEIAEKNAKELEKEYSIKTKALLLDITDSESVDGVINKIEKDFNGIDGLVNCAYPRNKLYGTRFEDITVESWKENIDMHLNGYFNITQKVSKVMINHNKGNIVNMASIYGILGPDFSIYEGTDMTMPAEYSAIKGGIISFTKYLATYLAKSNIRVNSISPGGILNNQNADFLQKYNSKTPLGRMADPEEIVGGVIYLLSDLASYITGHNLVIDGGWSIW